jgi:hypothetical protein
MFTFTVKPAAFCVALIKPPATSAVGAGGTGGTSAAVATPAKRLVAMTRDAISADMHFWRLFERVVNIEKMVKEKGISLYEGILLLAVKVTKKTLKSQFYLDFL